MSDVRARGHVCRALSGTHAGLRSRYSLTQPATTLNSGCDAKATLPTREVSLENP